MSIFYTDFIGGILQDFKYTGCLNPIIATFNYKKSNNLFNDKTCLTILGNLKHLSKVHNNSFIINLLSKDNIIKLPCRQCINCAMKKAREWSMRNCLEARDFDDDQKWFLTLTYDNDNVNKVNKVNSLSHSDITNFMKKLRSYFKDDKIRFFASGEYGSKTYRPHYHIILYGITFKNSSFEFLYSKKSGDKTFYYYRNDIIQKLWDKGITVICNFDDAEASYVSQYTTKKLNNYKNPYYYLKEKKIIPEFIQMSRRPGIAKHYYDIHKDEFYYDKNDTMMYHTDYKTIYVKPFAFYDRLFDLENPDMLKFFKENRKAYGLKYDFFLNYDFNKPIYSVLEDLNRQLKNKLKGDNGFENLKKS